MTNDSIWPDYSHQWMAHEFMEKNFDKIRFIPTSHTWMIKKGPIWEQDNSGGISRSLISFMEMEVIKLGDMILDLEAREREATDERELLSISRKIIFYKKCIFTMSNAHFFSNVKNMLEEFLTISNDIFNINLSSINLLNGIFELDEMKLRDRTNDDYNKFVCNFEYDKDAICPIWEEIIRTILPDEEQQLYLQQFLGYCLSGDIKEEKFMIFTGSGGNGKSTTIVTIADMLSGYAKVAPSEAFVSANSNNDVRRAGFEGARYVYCEEIQKYYSLNTEFIKTFASYGTKISARHMRQEPYTYTNTAKFIISANFPPKLGDTGASIKRRLVIVPFNINVMTTPLVRFKGNLELLLRNEYPGIFNWALKGYKLYKYNGSLVLPESLEKYQSEYLEGNEILLDFIQEIITFQSDKKDVVLGQNTLVENNRPPRVKSDVVKKPDMYIAYRNWCVSKKEDKPLGKHLFHEELIQSLKKINDEVSIVKRDTGYYYKGISIKSIYMVEGGKI